MNAGEPQNVAAFKAWLLEHGATIHPDICFKPVSSGFDVVACKDVSADTTVVSIPFSLAITPELARRSLAALLDTEETTLSGLTERQLECVYICMHWIIDPGSSGGTLKHAPYIQTLPAPEKLRTPLHFTPAELQSFQGSNLFGATLDRRREWEEEWQQCKGVVASENRLWAERFTWERYLTASTYISSRAFPSTLLSSAPSLVTTPTSYPVLLPGIDALNHARAHPVSWLVSSSQSHPQSQSAKPDPSSESEPSISLVIHALTPKGTQLFNNYGPKPNAELILGYGFSLPNNPDDTIVLKIGGPSAPPPPAAASSSSSSSAPPAATSSGRWEVGRNARGAEPVWEAVLAAVCAQSADDLEEAAGGEDGPSIEDELCAADMLADMAQQLHDRLPPFPPAHADDSEMRAEVVRMLEHYLEGQRNILRALVAFARAKEAGAMEKAREQGLNIVEEEEEGDEDESE